MRPNALRTLWQSGGAAVNGWLAIPNSFSAEVTRIIRSPAVRERLVSQGAEVHTMSPTEFTAFFERERKQWAGTVAQSGVKID